MQAASRSRWIGMCLGFLGLVGFALTLPATRLAHDLGVLFLTSGRAAGAGLLALIALCLIRPPWPQGWRAWTALAAVASGAVVIFPAATAAAMREVPASHGALIAAIAPLVTVGLHAAVSGTWPARRWWWASGAGALLVAGYALWEGNGQFALADAWLALAIVAVAMAYAAGALVSASLGAWAVICWALVLALPVTLPLALYAMPGSDAWTVKASLGFAWLTLISMFGAYIAWYRGMHLAGVAPVARLQLLQPWLTMASAALLLAEPLSPLLLIIAALVLIAVAMGR